MKTLYIIRGVSGSGKSTLAATLVAALAPNVAHFEADNYFYNEEGVYEFDRRMLSAAHSMCRTHTRRAMRNSVGSIIVSNTTTTDKEVRVYEDLAGEHGYKVVSIVVENRHGSSSIHDVPPETLAAQRLKLRASLKL